MQVNRRSFLGALLATGAAALVPLPASAAQVANGIPFHPTYLVLNGHVINCFDVEIEEFDEFDADDAGQRRFPCIVIRAQPQIVDIDVKFDIDE